MDCKTDCGPAKATETSPGQRIGIFDGVGLGWDSPWLNPGEPTKLVPGMVLCLEKTLSRGGYLGDFEETVLVTEQGVERITDAPIRRW